MLVERLIEGITTAAIVEYIVVGITALMFIACVVLKIVDVVLSRKLKNEVDDFCKETYKAYEETYKSDKSEGDDVS